MSEMILIFIYKCHNFFLLMNIGGFLRGRLTEVYDYSFS